MQNIGKTIRSHRHNKGWSQDETARQLGISIPAYSKIETGITDINLSRVLVRDRLAQWQRNE